MKHTNHTKLVSIPEYASIKEVSSQSVYAKIRKGSLKVELVNNKKMLRIEKVENTIDDSCQHKINLLNLETSFLKDNIKANKKQTKKQTKRIKKQETRIENLEKLVSEKDEYIKIMYSGFLLEHKRDNDYVDAEIVKKKKKK